jgi:hypothetical protein
LTTSAATVVHKWRIEKNPYEVEIATAMTIIRSITIDGNLDYIDDIMVMLLGH